MPNRLASLRHAGAVLDRILDQPALVSAVRELEPAALHALIQHVGLEDCGELVALASREQLQEVFDEDLWHSERAGEEARFDPRRFALWLEVLVEQGASLAASVVGELDEDLLTMALSQLLLVIDIESMAVRMACRRKGDDDEQLEKQLESTLHHELESYRLIARDASAFEAVMTVLLELDQRDHATLARLLDRCCRISSEYIEDHGGLHDVLTAAQTSEQDVAGAREERRERAGFVPPSQAVAFLTLAKQTPLSALRRSDAEDPITRAHFRQVEHTPRARRRSPARDSLMALLERAGVVTPKARPLPAQAGGTALRRALASLQELDGALHAQRMLELAYLGNVLLAAQGMRPVEAAQRALDLCERGAEELLGARLDGAALRTTDLVKLFRIGFHLSLR